MSAESFDVGQIDSIDLSERQKIDLKNGDGSLVLLWSRHFDKSGQPRKETADLIFTSEEVLSKFEIEGFQKRLQQKLNGGCWHDID